MELYAITVSTNYEDLLNIIIHQNYKFFTRWYIVTSITDTKTIDLVQRANYSNIELLFYNFKSYNAIFNFGGARQYAQLHSIEKNGLGKATLFLDSDIYLPDNFLEILKLETLNENKLYGVKMRYDYSTLSSFKRRDTTNVCHYNNTFYGFFQLFIQTPDKFYQSSVDCSKCDLVFNELFTEKKNLPLTVYHLGKSGVHWHGRLTHMDFLIDE